MRQKAKMAYALTLRVTIPVKYRKQSLPCAGAGLSSLGIKAAKYHIIS
ncbi:MAG: hypothetical protein QME12_02895 [Nanoarchaeota archaeon]|nr:hypothetical protein [Nanoarchaeota archaeon]